ncbi:thioredoxin family protein [Stenotrophomonas sp.]|uniref:thioredoxin family protein n=1 Tax=Stenotrophomonas sp. TaxID=69392 RepID=UPI0019AAFF38|nr:thioredoxin family protein [Stenotrophomonas sp.]MBD3826684.1 thioredoxin family protein [Stenotrophomonas sp.]
MAFARDAVAVEPEAASIAASEGWLLLEFGAPWCGHCIAAQPALQVLVDGQALAHVKVEDGKGRPLGRAFRVTLWPTVVLLHDGQERARVVRPRDSDDLGPLLVALARG